MHGVSSAAVSRALLPAVLLAAYAVAFGLMSLGRGLTVFDDHPGQLYRLHHVVTLGWAPWRLDPGWWAGYAELQYYPPGAAWLGAAIHASSLGWLDVGRSYEAVLWIAWMLPGLTTFMLLNRILGSGWLALPGAFVALTLSAGSRSGVEEGLRWGLIAARLGWGLLPLVALSLVGWIDGARRIPLLASPLIAAVILLHPAHAPAALTLLLLGAWIGQGAGRRRARQASAVAVLALGLTALWLLPLLAHLRMALPLAWGPGSLAGLAWELARPLVVVLALTQLAAWMAMRSGGNGQAIERWLHVFTPVMAAEVVLDAIAAPAIGVLWLPADRLVDSLLLALIIGASMAGPRLAARLERVGPPGVAAGLILGALVLSRGSPEPALTLWPSRGEWPTRDEVVRGGRLDVLWRSLRDGPPGRVLFLRSALRLDYRPEWWRPHSHITSLTPMHTGRGIINGTFTHPSPVAGLLYTGSAEPRPITLLVEQRDGVSLFGKPLDSLTAGELRTWMERLGISAVVASEEETERLAFLDIQKDFNPPRTIGPFMVYFARRAVSLPARAGPQIWRLPSQPGPSGWRSAGFAFSPLWKAESDGELLPTRRDQWGMLEVEMPGHAGSVILRHDPGMVERLGVLVSALSAMAFLIAALRQVAHRRNDPAGSTGWAARPPRS
jgi:hypothetical protein